MPHKHSDKVLKARARVLLRSPFFGAILASAPMHAVPGLGTAATDMVRIVYDPDFFEALPVDEVMGVMAHEVLHIALKHGLRRQGRDPVLWNIACDYAINLILVDADFVLPKGGLLDPAYRDMSAEKIYSLLESQSGRGGGSGKGGGSGGSGKGGIPGTGRDLLEPGSLGADGQPDPDAQVTPGALTRIDQTITATVAQASNMARMAGKLPGSLDRAINDLIHPPVPWQDLLRPLVRSIDRHDSTWTRRNRRFSDIYLPSLHGERVGRVVIIGDTSGSISNKELRVMGGAIASIAEEVSPQTIHVLWADTRVAGEQVFESGDPIDLSPQGGGGTDMRVPLDRAATLEPDVVIMLTDGHTPWPCQPPEFPLIVVCTTSVSVPVGEVVRV